MKALPVVPSALVQLALTLSTIAPAKSQGEVTVREPGSDVTTVQVPSAFNVPSLSVQPAGEFDSSLTFKSGIDLKTVMQNSEFGEFVMLIEVFGNDFSPAAEFFTIEPDGSVKALGNLHEMTELLQVNQLSTKEKTVLAWPASTKDNLLFIVDAKTKFDPKTVEQLGGKNWAQFNRLAQEKGFTIEMAVVPEGNAPAAPTTTT